MDGRTDGRADGGSVVCVARTRAEYGLVVRDLYGLVMRGCVVQYLYCDFVICLDVHISFLLVVV